MEKLSGKIGELLKALAIFGIRCLLRIICVGPVPEHMAFIMDGNRRFAKRQNKAIIAGHKAGYASLIFMLGYCCELGVKYVTVYAFSIDNFKRSSEEVGNLMDLFQEKFERLLEHDSIVYRYGIRVHLIGDLKLLSEPVRVAGENLMKATAENNRVNLLFCVAYTSRDEVVHAIRESCKFKRCEIPTRSKENGDGSQQGGGSEAWNEITNMGSGTTIELVDIEKHMYMAVAPHPDIVIRSSGQNRLSNFLLYQTANSLFYSPAALWPELGLCHLLWSILNFQRTYQYLEKINKNI